MQSEMSRVARESWGRPYRNHANLLKHLEFMIIPKGQNPLDESVLPCVQLDTVKASNPSLIFCAREIETSQRTS